MKEFNEVSVRKVFRKINIFIFYKYKEASLKLPHTAIVFIIYVIIIMQ